MIMKRFGFTKSNSPFFGCQLRKKELKWNAREMTKKKRLNYDVPVGVLRILSSSLIKGFVMKNVMIFLLLLSTRETAMSYFEQSYSASIFVGLNRSLFSVLEAK